MFIIYHGPTGDDARTHLALKQQPTAYNNIKSVVIAGWLFQMIHYQTKRFQLYNYVISVLLAEHEKHWYFQTLVIIM